MEKTEKETILKQAEEVFFLAMLDGYAGEQKNSTKTVSPDGRKTITFISGQFKVIDEYWTNPYSDFSAGTTTILYYEIESARHIPVWWMSYGGCYPKEVISFLKEALKEEYQRKTFTGGRGPRYKEFDKKLEYNNWSEGDFRRFVGHESIRDYGRGSASQIGYHDFYGMSFL